MKSNKNFRRLSEPGLQIYLFFMILFALGALYFKEYLLAAAEGAVGFLLPPIEKEQLFGGIDADGVLPRKTFSMGHAREKRYYLEARKIR